VLGPLRRACPEVRPLGALVARSDSVAPVVTVGKAAARPANHRRTDAPQRFDQRLPQAAYVRNRRILAHPNAVVNHTAQILDEVPVDLRRNRRDRLVNQSLDQTVARGGSQRGSARHTGGGRAQKLAAAALYVYPPLGQGLR